MKCRSILIPFLDAKGWRAITLVPILVFSLVGAISQAFGDAEIYTDPTDFETVTTTLGTPTIIDFEDLDASPLNDTYLDRDEFNGNFYADEGITLNGCSCHFVTSCICSHFTIKGRTSQPLYCGELSKRAKVELRGCLKSLS
jgi:hypothetical protein